MKIFISYRRADSGGIAGRIYDSLVAEFGKDNVFRDVDSVSAGSDIQKATSLALEECDVLIVTIGPQWLLGDRLDNPSDFVRLEISSALHFGKIVIPVLVEGAGFPYPDDLPEEIRPIGARNAIVVDSSNFSGTIRQLIESLRQVEFELRVNNSVSQEGQDRPVKKASTLPPAKQQSNVQQNIPPIQQQTYQDFDDLNIEPNIPIDEQQEEFQEAIQQFSNVEPDSQQMANESSVEAPEQQAVTVREELEITTRALSDLPTTEDWLNFSDYAQALADFIKNENTAKPLTIGIDAAWGMGKTSLMRMIEKELNRDEDGNEHPKKFPTVWFNAWKYDQEESLWAALALEILLQVRRQMSFRERLLFNAHLAWKRTDKAKLIPLIVKTASIYVATILLGLIVLGLTGFAADAPDIFADYGRAVISLGLIPPALSLGREIRKQFTGASDFNIGEYLQKPNYRERVGFLAEFEDDFARVVDVVTKNGRWPLVVFIDDLDRCAPPRATEIVEAINVLLDAQHCVFILGMDAQTVAASIEAKYKDIKEFIDEADYLIGMSLGQRFLEKIVQISFHIPRADPDLMSDFVNRSLKAGRKEDTDGRRDAGEAVPVEVQQAEELIQAELRTKKYVSVDEAAKAVKQQAPNLSDTVVEQAQQEVFAKRFDDSEDVQRAIHEMVRYLGYNPRRVKRFINVFRLQTLIANRRELLQDDKIDLQLLAKWVVMITRWPDISEAMQTDNGFVSRLKTTSGMAAALKADDNAPKAKKMTEDNRRDMQLSYDRHLGDERVERLLLVDDLLRLLDNITESDAGDLQTYFYLSDLTV